ncbi:IS21-like element helper ATPase IstB [Pectinatus brassicae]|uniref:DNA replication protein DnaC n=1 Tax=Pectinatus brassicae TaxID=862415 RepID=A0A840UXQ0_9FIRM|nr:IS21-like element helper ATPase IstB [Pectinatus brassicae]MBB5337644.1 DNA replication protein DnaC [Pectinatus brassicae]
MQNSGIKESLAFYAKQLKLPTFSNLTEPVSHFKAGQSLDEFILEIMKREYDSRQEKLRQRRIKRTHFPLLKTIEEFDLTKLQHVKPEYVKQLANCDFISRHENLVMIGNPGTGKTHLMSAIGLKACLLGYKVLFKNATTLASELRESRDNYQLRKIEKMLAGVDLLLIDELSYASFNQEESELLFKVIAERSERSSTIITTNLAFSRWTEMFANDTLVAALVDRLTYHSNILNMNGESYRLQSSQQKC